jgi:hypothetical protein
MGVNDRQIGVGGSKSMPFLVGIKGEVIQGDQPIYFLFLKNPSLGDYNLIMSCLLPNPHAIIWPLLSAPTFHML